MLLPFYKYQSTGNDFILIDNRNQIFDINKHELITNLCHRKLGIGADGIILLQTHSEFDFKMIYFNSDGHESSFCGNGGRAIVDFANQLGLINDKTSFYAMDGKHNAIILSNNFISLSMKNVNYIDFDDKNNCILDTGSPHYVYFSSDVGNINLVDEARKIRFSDRFKEKGINVNFIQKNGEGIKIRTYERGVENETLSCGTGVVASALSAILRNIVKTTYYCNVETEGGKLTVIFKRNGDKFTNIYLEGPTQLVFKGEINI